MPGKKIVAELLKIVVVMSLAACSVVSPTATPLPSATLPFTLLPKSTPVPTSTQPARTVVKNQCFDVFSALPSDKTLPGILVLSSPDGLSLLNFGQQTRREILGLIYGVGVSPDRKWLSYVYEEEIIIESADGKFHAQVPTEQGWLIFDKVLWLDNERLSIPIFPVLERGEVAHTIVLNPFTDEQQVLLSDYPEVAQYQIGFASSPRLHFGHSSVVYDPSLNLAIYPQLTMDGWYLVLWDRQSEKILVKIPEDGLFGHMPLWLPNGNHFVVVGSRDRNGPREWLMVSQNGEVRQLTHFENLYAQFEIGGTASVSPDGHYLAFGSSQDADSHDATYDDPKQLMILDLDTLEIFNTCITYSYPDPIWSPGSRYITVLTRDSTNKPSEIVVLDVTQRWGAKIAEDPEKIPTGWLRSP